MPPRRIIDSIYRVLLGSAIPIYRICLYQVAAGGKSAALSAVGKSEGVDHEEPSYLHLLERSRREDTLCYVDISNIQTVQMCIEGKNGWKE